MNFTGRTVLVYLEEDNIQRAYFRVRPLLTDLGSLGPDLVSQFPDEGYLRIVPDKNEQHTFKERMRTLGSICLLDLSNLQHDNQKIRTNKNYSPAKGEKNQFIVYSDAVKPLTDSVFFHVVNEDKADSAVTPLYYTRSGANIQGPFSANPGAAPAETQRILPDDPNLYTAILPDGSEMLIYLRPAAPVSPAPAAGSEEPQRDQSAAPASPEASAAPSEARPEAASPETPAAPAPAEQAAPAEQPSPAEQPAPAASAWQMQLNAILSGSAPATPRKPEPAPAPSAPPAAAPQKTEKTPLPPVPPRAEKAPADKASPARPAVPPREAETALGRIQALNGSLQVSSQRLRDERRAFPLRPVQDVPSGGGTKLYRPGIERRAGVHARNSLAEAVEQQRALSKFETRYEAPGAVISDPSSLGNVPNPVEMFKSALRRTWNLPETHRQVADCILATSGMRQVLVSTLTDGRIDLTIRAMQAQLQDLEAERLMTLMQLDDAKKNLQAARDAALAQAEKDRKNAIEALDRVLSEKKSLVETVKAQQQALSDEFAQAEKTLSALPGQTAVRAPVAAGTPGREEMVSRVRNTLRDAGFDADEDAALALLILLAQTAPTGRLGIAASSAADALSAVDAVSAALGAASLRVCAGDGDPKPLRVLPGGDGMVLAADTSPVPAAADGTVHVTCFPADDVFLSQFTDRMLDLYRCDPFPVWWIRQDPESIPKAPGSFPAVSSSALADVLLEEGELDADSVKLLKEIRKTLNSAGAPLPGRSAAAMRVFILSAAPHMKGGIAAALDWAVLAYVVPHVRFFGLDGSILTDAAAALPHALTELTR